MINPYQPPASSLREAGKPVPARSSKVWLFLALFLSCLPAVVAMLLLPHFGQIFESFVADLPLASMFLRDFYLALWMAPIAVGAAWRLWPNAPHLGPVLTAASFAFAVIASAVVAYLLYLPIFRLAENV
jgi:hypothetical protein